MDKLTRTGLESNNKEVLKKKGRMAEKEATALGLKFFLKVHFYFHVPNFSIDIQEIVEPREIY